MSTKSVITAPEKAKEQQQNQTPNQQRLSSGDKEFDKAIMKFFPAKKAIQK